MTHTEELVYSFITENEVCTGKEIQKYLKRKKIDVDCSVIRRVVWNLVTIYNKPIGSSSKYYFRIKDYGDYQVARRHLEHRIKKQAMRLRALDKAYRELYQHQLI